MSWNRILYYSIFSLLVSLLAAMIFADTHGALLMWGFILAMGVGYAYGTFQVLAVMKKDFQKLMDDLDDKP